jgi:seryl-tRNA synthetase
MEAIITFMTSVVGIIIIIMLSIRLTHALLDYLIRRLEVQHAHLLKGRKALLEDIQRIEREELELMDSKLALLQAKERALEDAERRIAVLQESVNADLQRLKDTHAQTVHQDRERRGNEASRNTTH